MNLGGFFSIVSAAWSKTSFAITLLRISDGWTYKFIWFIIISVNLSLGLAAAVHLGQLHAGGRRLERIY